MFGDSSPHEQLLKAVLRLALDLPDPRPAESHLETDLLEGQSLAGFQP